MSTIKTITTGILILTGLAILSVAAGCLVAGVAHYNLGWDADRANAVGNTVSSIVFVGGLLLSRK